MQSPDHGSSDYRPVWEQAIKLGNLQHTEYHRLSRSPSASSSPSPLAPLQSSGRAPILETEELPLLTEERDPSFEDPSITCARASFETQYPLLHTLRRRAISTVPERITDIMEKIKNSKAARLVDKLAVESEPGLTNAQLMLTNHDLKPGG